MSKIVKFFSSLIFTAALAGVFIFVFHDHLQNLWSQVQTQYFPCSQPIAYSLGAFDTKFGLSKKDFLSAVSAAEAVWEKPAAKDLFVYTEDGPLKINLIYDIRQEATVKLQELNLNVTDNQKSYEAVKAKYDSLKAQYAKDRATLTAKISAVEVMKNKYEAEVEYWNSHGGASKETHSQLEKDRLALNVMIDQINQMQKTLNTKVDNINALVVVLNRLGKTLNMNVATYNQIGGQLAGEFEEGTYQSNENGEEIDIYQFDDRAKLIRVLAHELGHALGLDHVEDSKAIMYRLNDGVNEKLTDSDLEALKNHCKL
jgi:predicted Zn-dependent protease